MEVDTFRIAVLLNGEVKKNHEAYPVILAWVDV